jgi:hypothetical protein
MSHTTGGNARQRIWLFAARLPLGDLSLVALPLVCGTDLDPDLVSIARMS